MERNLDPRFALGFMPVFLRLILCTQQEQVFGWPVKKVKKVRTNKSSFFYCSIKLL